MDSRFTLAADGVLRFQPWLAWGWLEHGFTTAAAGDFRDFAHTRALAGDLGFTAAALRQVHSNEVVVVDGAEPMLDDGDRPEADALVTRQPGVLLAVRTADCVPILLADPAQRAIAAVHAGWRGSAAHIVGRAVQQLTSQLGAAATQLQAIIGPCIGADAYEVGPEVASQFDPADVIPNAREHLDLAGANRRQLLAAGLDAANIFLCGACTFQGADQFHSHRRDGERSGRMLHYIGVRAEPGPLG